MDAGYEIAAIDEVIPLLKGVRNQVRLSNLLAIESQIRFTAKELDNDNPTPQQAESYLNTMDRLAKCVLLGYFDEAEIKDCYRECFANCVTTHSAKHFKNIVALAESWK